MNLKEVAITCILGATLAPGVAMARIDFREYDGSVILSSETDNSLKRDGSYMGCAFNTNNTIAYNCNGTCPSHIYSSAKRVDVPPNGSFFTSGTSTNTYICSTGGWWKCGATSNPIYLSEPLNGGFAVKCPNNIGYQLITEMTMYDYIGISRSGYSNNMDYLCAGPYSNINEYKSSASMAYKLGVCGSGNNLGGKYYQMSMCPAGYYLTNASGYDTGKICKACPNDGASYNPTEMHTNTSCIADSCMAGYKYNNGKCELCTGTGGYYNQQNNHKLTSCTLSSCMAGYYKNGTSCSKCGTPPAHGQYNKYDKHNNVSCILYCDAGYYSTGSACVEGYCGDCPDGQYQLNYHDSNRCGCYDCPDHASCYYWSTIYCDAFSYYDYQGGTSLPTCKLCPEGGITEAEVKENRNGGGMPMGSCDPSSYEDIVSGKETECLYHDDSATIYSCKSYGGSDETGKYEYRTASGAKTYCTYSR